MKKALTKTVLFAVTIVILAAIIPLSANASTSNKNDNKTQIYTFLTNELGLNSAAACGIMANIDAESDFNPSSVIRDSNGLLSGGICQWNGSRFSRLRSFCSANGYSYLSIKGQLHYLASELKSSGYKYIYDYMKCVSNTAQGAYDAAYYWCYYFEVPARRATKSVQRGNSAKNTYWATYGKVDLKDVTLSNTSTNRKIDIDDSITLKWTSAGSYADYYTLIVAKKKAGTQKYDWDNAKTYTLSASTLSKTFKSGTFEKGRYGVYVKATNKLTGTTVQSNASVFDVVCTTHDFDTVVTKQPTTVKAGKRVSTCKQCGFVKSEVMNPFPVKSFVKRSVTDLEKVSVTSDSAKISWKQFSWAEGYCIYLKQGKSWQKVKTVKAFDKTSCIIKNLDRNTTYQIRVKAYIKVDGKTYMTPTTETLTLRTAR